MKNKKIFKVALYVICAGLICFYLTVLYFGQNPQVGTEYRMYYLTHELSEWPGYGNLSYKLGTKEYYSYSTKAKPIINVATRKGTGWETYEYNGNFVSQNTEERSYVYYVINEKMNNAPTIELSISDLIGNSVKVYANETLLGEVNADNMKHSYLTLPQSCIGSDGLVKLTFEVGSAGETFHLNSIIIK